MLLTPTVEQYLYLFKNGDPHYQLFVETYMIHSNKNASLIRNKYHFVHFRKIYCDKITGRDKTLRIVDSKAFMHNKMIEHTVRMHHILVQVSNRY